MTDTDVAIIGAGPYGLAAAAHLRRAGMDVRVIGQPMSFWQNMPAGLLLRSNWTATCIAEYEGELSLDCAGIRDLRSTVRAQPARFAGQSPSAREFRYSTVITAWLLALLVAKRLKAHE